QRKVYFVDPLLGRIASRMIPGARVPGPDAVRENLVAIGLYRAATERLVQVDPVRGSLCFWKSGRGTEIDFVVADDVPAASGERLPIEVKGDSRSAIANARRSISPTFGDG